MAEPLHLVLTDNKDSPSFDIYLCSTKANELTMQRNAELLAFMGASTGGVRDHSEAFKPSEVGENLAHSDSLQKALLTSALSTPGRCEVPSRVRELNQNKLGALHQCSCKQALLAF